MYHFDPVQVPFVVCYSSCTTFWTNVHRKWRCGSTWFSNLTEVYSIERLSYLAGWHSSVSILSRNFGSLWISPLDLPTSWRISSSCHFWGLKMCRGIHYSPEVSTLTSHEIACFWNAGNEHEVDEEKIVNRFSSVIDYTTISVKRLAPRIFSSAQSWHHTSSYEESSLFLRFKLLGPIRFCKSIMNHQIKIIYSWGVRKSQCCLEPTTCRWDWNWSQRRRLNLKLRLFIDSVERNAFFTMNDVRTTTMFGPVLDNEGTILMVNKTMKVTHLHWWFWKL